MPHNRFSFTGSRCDQDINECENNPCQSDGNCTDHVAFYTCQCLPGFNGKSCENKINPCKQKPCLNGKLAFVLQIFPSIATGPKLVDLSLSLLNLQKAFDNLFYDDNYPFFGIKARFEIKHVSELYTVKSTKQLGIGLRKEAAPQTKDKYKLVEVLPTRHYCCQLDGCCQLFTTC